MVTKSLGYEASDIAKWFVNETDRESGDDITHLKVQKLVYYAQGWSLAHFNAPLFDEDLEAWAHGPVAPSVWNKFRAFGYISIPMQKITRKLAVPHATLLASVSEIYGIYTAKRLESMTHKERPWLIARGSIPLHERCSEKIKKPK